MVGTKGYSSYRGRGPKWKILLAIVLVAVIAAAVAAMDGGNGLTLRSVRRVKPSGRSSWGQAGVNAYTEPF